MNNILNLYCTWVLDVLEKELKKQRNLVMRRGIFACKCDKDYLVKLEKLWYEKSIYFGKLIDEEVKFNNNIYSLF